ncbi:MAG: hypothetical protein K9H15_07315 [Bacteroidales bacterium]|nr:hypothetical protein [Bacteroidales bacterium]MCF8350963.1 hypothetical protein [Bacteroidales bacterium]
MKKLFLTFLIVLTSLYGFSQFRNTTWAFDKQKVKEATADSLMMETDTSLVYASSIGKWNTLLTFVFTNGALTEGVYDLQIEKQSKKLYFDDYAELRDILTTKYGQSSTGLEHIWIDDQQQDNPAMHPYALSKGDLIIRTFWKTAYMNIELIMKGINNRININIRYSNPFIKEQKAVGGF